MTGNPEILARGYIIDAASHVNESDVYFSEERFDWLQWADRKVLFEMSDEDRGMYWSLSINDVSKLES